MAANGTTNAERVGFIGLGIMGRPMVANLIGSGIVPTVWNRSQAGVDACTELGAVAAESPRAVAEASDVLVTIVTDSSDVVEVLVDGPDGDAERAAIGGLASGSVVVDMSTISPAVTRSIAEQLRARGVEMLDAPVSGGDTGAKAGTLSIMVGGEAEVLERCRPILEAMGRTITHCGPNGAGQTVKLCNQVAIAGALLGVCEALALTQKSGVDAERDAGRDQRGRSGIVAALEPGAADRRARLRAGLHDPADAEGPASGAGSGRRSVAAAAEHIAGAPAVLPTPGAGGRRRWDAGAGAGRGGAGRHDDRRLSCPPLRGNSSRLSRAG